MPLRKHISGQPLTAAEHGQRVDAARSRWGHRAGILAGGTAAGAIVGYHVGHLRQAVRNENQAARLGISFARGIAEASRHAETTAEARGAQREQAIRQRTAFRLRSNPETSSERQQRTSDVLSGRSRPTLRNQPLVIGTAENLRVYDYQLEQLNRRLKRVQGHVAALEAAEESDFAAGGAPAPARPGLDISVNPAERLRTRRTEVEEIKGEIKQLTRFRDAAFARIARSGHLRRGETVPSHVVRQFRGGERLDRIRVRVGEARTEVRTRQNTLLDVLTERTAANRTRAGEAAIARETAALQHAYLAGEYGSRLLRTAGTHSAIGAGIGLTVAGLGILARHIVEASHRRKMGVITKLDPETFHESGAGLSRWTHAESSSGPLAGTEEQPLAKARRDTAARMAAMYRRWIDRLLGKSETPMNVGDDLADALGPVIAESYLDGAASPPIDEDSDKRWHIDFDFDVLNPAVRRHMAEYALDRIVAISNEQRETIRTALMQQSVLQGIGPREVARTIRLSIGLTPYQQAVVQTFRSQLIALDPRALNRKLRDKRYDRTVRKAIDTQTPLTEEQLDAMTDAYHRRMLALRAETIARTESIKATTYGGLARAQEVLDAHPELDVIKGWGATDDERTRDTHVDLNGKEVQGMLTPWITTAGNMIRWPFDERAPAEEVVNCRCYLRFRFIPRRGQLMAVAA